MIAACPLLIAIGIAMFLKPEFFYRLTESWKHEGSSEPSNLFIFSTKVGGIMCAIVGVFCLVILLLDFFNVI